MIDLHKLVENEIAEWGKRYIPPRDYSTVTVENEYNILAVDSESMFLFRNGEYYWVNHLRPDYLERCYLEDMHLTLTKSSGPFFVFRHPVLLKPFEDWPIYQAEILRIRRELLLLKRAIDDKSLAAFREASGKRNKPKSRAAHRVA